MSQAAPVTEKRAAATGLLWCDRRMRFRHCSPWHGEVPGDLCHTRCMQARVSLTARSIALSSLVHPPPNTRGSTCPAVCACVCDVLCVPCVVSWSAKRLRKYLLSCILCGTKGPACLSLHRGENTEFSPGPREKVPTRCFTRLAGDPRGAWARALGPSGLGHAPRCSLGAASSGDGESLPPPCWRILRQAQGPGWPCSWSALSASPALSPS